MTTRKELIGVLGERYREGSRAERSAILDQLVEITGYHRKHTIRCLRGTCSSGDRRPRARIYDEAVEQALLVLWETSDRLCGKRLRPILPTLVEAAERHGHLHLDPLVRERLLRVSAATIDRILARKPAQDGARGRRRVGMGSAIRRSIPVRTFADWHNPPPGFLEVDMVEHCGSRKVDGDFVHSLVLTDIATGWTECVALPCRSQELIVQAIREVERVLPFAILGIDTDNDSAFMGEALYHYCQDRGIDQTRSRAYKKNDQAWVEQKNGAIVRRMVGYGRLRGPLATQRLARLYAQTRWFINGFQPSFKLISKTRDGARVRKQYDPPKTPLERLLAANVLSEARSVQIQAVYRSLDPIALIQGIREVQKQIADLVDQESPRPHDDIATDTQTFLKALKSSWKQAEVRPTHVARPRPARHWRTRKDPLAAVWPRIELWLEQEPELSATVILARLAKDAANSGVDDAQLRTLQRRIKRWRADQVDRLLHLPWSISATDHEETKRLEELPDFG